MGSILHHGQVALSRIGRHAPALSEATRAKEDHGKVHGMFRNLLLLPSGKHTKNYGKWPFIVDFPMKHGGYSYYTYKYLLVNIPKTMERSTIFHG